MGSGKRSDSSLHIGARFQVAAVYSLCIATVAALGALESSSSVDDVGLLRAVESGLRESAPQTASVSDSIADEEVSWTVLPACDSSCPYYDVMGNEQTISAHDGSVATPGGTTYSVHHMVGADTNGDGLVSCFFIAAEPPPDAADDVVTFDLLPEDIRTDILGTVPTVTESAVDNANGTHVLTIDTSSPAGTDLFPSGQQDPASGTPLTAACFLLGLQDPLDWEGVDSVSSATVSMFKDGVLQIGPLDVTGLFSSPWAGFVGLSIPDAAGIGINSVSLEINVGKALPDQPGACCVGGVCIGDISEGSCALQGGAWSPGGTCGQRPDLPPAICVQPTCGYVNGQPLDDLGASTSQYAPDHDVASGAADDFVLTGTGSRPCRISAITSWTTHQFSAVPVDPSSDYWGVNVTVYLDRPVGGPAGEPATDGSHVPDIYGGIVYSQTVAMSEIFVRQQSRVSCLAGDLFELSIPVDLTLPQDTKYWLEVQPIMDTAILGEVGTALSDSSNGSLAMRIAPSSGVGSWQVIPGNDNACPSGDPATPPAGTRRDLAFEMVGELVSAPANDDCADAPEVFDGFVAFDTVGASTDGADEPGECNFFQYTHLESDVWFDYRASCTGDLKVSLCGSQYDTKLAVYSTCDVCPPRGFPLQCNEDAACGLQSEVELPVSKGNCYQIRVGGFRGETGAGILSIECAAPPAIVGACCGGSGICLGTMGLAECDARDGRWTEGENCSAFQCHNECVDCITLETDVSFEGSSSFSTGVDDSSCANSDTKDVWHCWTADCTGVATFDLCDSAFDTTLSVFDACGGAELACNDDQCGQQSKIDMEVSQGTTYYVRVSGFGGDTGDYSMLVRPCAQACCLSDGRCFDRRVDVCEGAGGTPLGEGTICLGDGNGDGVDDACTGCPDATIAASDPLDGTIDARQPHTPDAVLPRQGIGSPGATGSNREPILITLDPAVAGAEDCFVLCETREDATLGANAIQAVSDIGGGAYEVVLNQAITAGGVTTISYIADGSFVSYTSHPGNVDGNSASGAGDILAIIDILNGVASPPWGIYSTDADRSGVQGASDILRVIDLLNGASLFETWLGVPQPDGGACP